MLKFKHKMNYIVDFDIPFDLNTCVFFDIETTGLSREYNYIYLIGLVTYDLDSGFSMLQLLIDDKHDEEKLVLSFKDEVSNKTLITYNGDSFDIPFINSKLVKYGHKPLDNSSFDIMKYTKANKYYLSLENHKLKVLENHLGINRDDIYSGKDCIQFYKDYQNSKDDEMLNRILKHNHDDIYSMPKLLSVIPLVESRKKIKVKDTLISIDDISLDNDMVNVNGKVLESKSIDQSLYHNYYNIRIENNKFRISIETNQAMVRDNVMCNYIDKEIFGLSNKINDMSSYSIPPNLMLLYVDKSPVIENIKIILYEILNLSI